METERLIGRMVLGVFAEDPKDFSLDTDIRCRRKDGSHFGVGGLKTDHASFAIETLESSIGTVDESYHNLSFPGRPCPFDQNIVARHDVLIAHGVATHLEGEDLTISDDVSERDALGGFDGFHGPSCSNASEEGKPVTTPFGGSSGQYVNRTTAIMGTLQQTFVLKIGNVFMDGSQGTEPKTAGDLFVGRGVPVLLGKT